MPLIRAHALVLQAFPYSDSSKILRLYCREHGLRSVIAKGAQRAKSRFGGLLEPFTEGEAHFYLKEGRDLHTLSGFDLLRSRQALGRDLGAFAGASLVAELVLRAGTEEPQPHLFQALVDTLDRLALCDPARAAEEALVGVWATVAILGFQPEIEACVHCGGVFGEDEPSRFDIEAGGTACFRCRPTGRVVDARTRREVGRMSRGAPQAGSLGDLSLHRALLRAFLATHLGQGRPLRSLELFAEQLY